MPIEVNPQLGTVSPSETQLETEEMANESSIVISTESLDNEEPQVLGLTKEETKLTINKVEEENSQKETIQKKDNTVSNNKSTNKSKISKQIFCIPV